jgi:hypothetical protein
LRIGVIKLKGFGACRVSTSYRPVKKIEQYTAECHRLLSGSDIAGGKLHVFEKFVPLKRQRRRGEMQSIHMRRSICEFMGWLTTMVAPVPSGIWRCLRRKRMFLWNHHLNQRHRFIRRGREKNSHHLVMTY